MVCYTRFRKITLHCTGFRVSQGLVGERTERLGALAEAPLIYCEKLRVLATLRAALQ